MRGNYLDKVISYILQKSQYEDLHEAQTHFGTLADGLNPLLYNWINEE